MDRDTLAPYSAQRGLGAKPKGQPLGFSGPVSTIQSIRRTQCWFDIFVHSLYQNPAFGGFDDFSDFVESASCETSKSCQKFTRGSNPCRGAKCRGLYANHGLTPKPQLSKSRAGELGDLARRLGSELAAFGLIAGLLQDQDTSAPNCP